MCVCVCVCVCVCAFMRKRKLTLNKCIGMEMEEIEFMHLIRFCLNKLLICCLLIVVKFRYWLDSVLKYVM